MIHFKRYSAFYIPYILFALIFTVLILCNGKADLHLWLTSFYTPVGDIFFRYYTEVGASVPYIVVAGLLFYKYRVALFVLITQLMSGLFAQLIKQSCDEPRPVKFFAENFPSVELHQISGVALHASHSLPSGHTTAAFAFFLALAYFTKKPVLHFLYFLLAVLVGYSRIYLSQHFALDVLVGSLIGLFVTHSWFLYFETLPLVWADGSLRALFSRKKN